ncbi:MAG: hypothetical protein IT303_11660 [Dehalococcoidia bacterium]|nr:hypothetical protein [Dehalococcoidia bacterium]
MIHAALSDEIKITLAKAAQAAGTTDIESDVIDMSGYEGVLFLVTFGAITAGAVTSIKAQQGAASNLSDAADLEGTGIAVADDDDGQTFVIDVYKPRERYVRAVVDRATQNAVVGEIYALLYGAKELPVTNTVANTLTLERHTSPAEGTA